MLAKTSRTCEDRIARPTCGGYYRHLRLLSGLKSRQLDTRAKVRWGEGAAAVGGQKGEEMEGRETNHLMGDATCH